LRISDADDDGTHAMPVFPRHGGAHNMSIGTTHRAPTLGPLTAGHNESCESPRLVPLSLPTAAGEVHGKVNTNIAPGHYSLPNLTVHRYPSSPGFSYGRSFESRFAAYDRANINMSTATAFINVGSLPDASSYKSGFKQTKSIKLVPHRSAARLVNGHRPMTPAAFDPYEVTPAPGNYEPALPDFRLTRSASSSVSIGRRPLAATPVTRAGGGGKPRAFSPSFLSSASATDLGTSWGTRPPLTPGRFASAPDEADAIS
jgi:hypothetical protein